MTKTETAALLVLVGALSGRTIGEVDVEAWHLVVGDLDPDDAQAAVVAHYRESTDWLSPAHVRAGVRRLRADRLTRADDTDPPDADPDDVVAYLDALRAGRVRKATGVRALPAAWVAGRPVEDPA